MVYLFKYKLLDDAKILANHFFDKYNIPESARQSDKLAYDIACGLHPHLDALEQHIIDNPETFGSIETFSIGDFVTKIIRIDWILWPVKKILEPAFAVFDFIIDKVLLPIVKAFEKLLSSFLGTDITIFSDLVILVKSLLKLINQFIILAIKILPDLLKYTLNYFQEVVTKIVEAIGTIKSPFDLISFFFTIIFTVLEEILSIVVDAIYNVISTMVSLADLSAAFREPGMIFIVIVIIHILIYKVFTFNRTPLDEDAGIQSISLLKNYYAGSI